MSNNFWINFTCKFISTHFVCSVQTVQYSTYIDTYKIWIFYVSFCKQSLQFLLLLFYFINTPTGYVLVFHLNLIEICLHMPLLIFNPVLMLHLNLNIELFWADFCSNVALNLRLVQWGPGSLVWSHKTANKVQILPNIYDLFLKN